MTSEEFRDGGRRGRAGSGRARPCVLALTLVSALVATCPATAGDPRSLRVRHLTKAQGLAQSTVHALHQDALGYMWLGTQDGLDRYDGLSFRHFRHDKRDPGSISSNQIWALAEDGRGQLWAATDDGLNRYDPASGTFATFRHDASDPSSLAGNRVRALARDGNGWLWVGTADGLSNFDPTTGRAQNFRHDPAQAGSLSGSEVLSVHVDADGTVWAGTRAGLDRLAPKARTFERFVHDPADPGALAAGAVRAIHRDRKGRLWVGTAQGLSLLDEATRRFRSYLHDPRDPSSLSAPLVRSLQEDADGRLWVGTTGGLNLLLPGERGFLRFQYDATDPDGLSNDNIFSLYNDRSGLLWIGTFTGGANLWNPYSWTFGHIKSRSDGTSLSMDSVSAIAGDAEGDVWIGTAGGLNRLDRPSGKVDVYRHRPEDPAGLSDDDVRALGPDHEGQLWVGTASGGVQRLDPRRGTFRRLELPGNPFVNGVAFIRQASNRDLWLGAFRAGVIRLRHPGPGFDTYDVVHYRRAGQETGSLTSDLVTCMAETAEGDVWIGTEDGGLSFLAAGSESFLTLRNDPQDPRSLSSDFVISLLIDGRGTLWVGTKGNGLDRLESFDRTTGRAAFRNYTERDGLPNGTVYGIQPDDAGNLWLSTNNGLARLDPTQGTFRAFRARHGLQSDEFNFGAHARGPRGELFFGGINGLNAFLPDQVRTNPTVPPILITGVYGRERRSLGPIGQRRMEVEPGDSLVAFEFVAPDFAAPEENRYSYRLAGFDDQWVELTQLRPATFTNLAARDYRFEVIAASADGVWNRRGAAVELRVLPAWWQTWWALTLFGLGALALATAGLRWRLAGLRRRSEELQALVSTQTSELSATVDRLKLSEQTALDAKMRALRALEEALDERRKAQEANRAKSVFLSNISHELRTPLNAVLGFAQLMERDEQMSPEHRDNLAVILRSGEHLLSLINDVLSFAKIEAGRLTLAEQPFELRRLVRDVEDMVRVRADAKRLRFDVEVETPLPMVSGDESRVAQVLLNLLGNAVKFTDRGWVRLQVAWNDGVGRFAVEDTGCGISAKELEQLFEPFVQASGGRRQLEGTGLGLAISHKLVGLMGGELEVVSEPGRGSVFAFSVALPAASGAQAISRRGRVTGLAPGQPTPRVLIADDAAENRDLMVRLLVPAGLDVRAVEDGEQAVAAWASWRPHLVLMDIRMPVLDGYGANQRIRQAEAESQSPRHTVIIALTASAFEHDRRRMLTSGFDDVLTKPFRSPALFDLLAEWLDLNFLYQDGSSSAENAALRMPLRAQLRQSLSRTAPGAAPAASRPDLPKSRPGQRILVAEDDPANQQVAQRALERLGLMVDVVGDGKSALDACQREAYSLIFMDVQMPVLDGIEATRAIRRLSGRGGAVPIIALTGLPTPEEKLHCLDAGMDDLLAKPFRLDDLRIMVERWLERPLKPAPPPSSPTDESGAQRAMEESRDVYVVEIRKLFLETAPFQLEGLRMAAAAFDLDRLATLSQALRTSAANLGATQLAAACDRLRAACLGEERPAGHEREIEETIAAVADAMQKTISDLRKARRAKMVAL
jgi:signal transduction histidine kinase/ligand-binding sensor domain-containing protein/DNA-binding response OmpR family regulator